MCPECKQPMLVVELDGIEVDHCTRCAGTWLDRGEWEHLGQNAGMDSTRIRSLAAGGRKLSTGRRRCPRCRKRLDLVRAVESPVLDIDICPRGHGLWLDKGEMESLISTAGSGPAVPLAHFFADLFQSELELHRKGE